MLVGEIMSREVSSGFDILQELIKLRWIPEILKSISMGNSSYSSILNSIPYLSHTELNRKLNILIEREAILKQGESSPSYHLKDFGEDLVHIFYHLEDLQSKYQKTLS